MPMPILRCRYCKFYMTHFTKNKNVWCFHYNVNASGPFNKKQKRLVLQSSFYNFLIAISHIFYYNFMRHFFFFQIIFSLDSPIQCDGAVSFLITLHGSASEENSSKVTELFRASVRVFL